MTTGKRRGGAKLRETMLSDIRRMEYTLLRPYKNQETHRMHEGLSKTRSLKVKRVGAKHRATFLGLKDELNVRSFALTKKQWLVQGIMEETSHKGYGEFYGRTEDTCADR